MSKRLADQLKHPTVEALVEKEHIPDSFDSSAGIQFQTVAIVIAMRELDATARKLDKAASRLQWAALTVALVGLVVAVIGLFTGSGG